MPDYSLKRPVINGARTDTWYVTWTDGRRSRRVSTKTTDKVAAEGFLQRFGAIQDLPPETFTVTTLADAYLAERQANPKVKYPKSIANSLKHIKRELGALEPGMITRLAIRNYVTRRRTAGVMDSTIDKELRFLRQALKFGKREGWLDKEFDIETPGGSPPRQRFLTRAEFATIYFSSSPLHLRTFLGLAIGTLARGKHILALRWDQVDFERGVIWYAPHDPGSRKRVQAAPMSDPLRTALQQAHTAAQTPFVIEWAGKPVKSVRKAYERAVALSGLVDAHRHDLRRSGASWAIQDGQSFDAVAALLGDSVEMTKKTYAVFSPSYLRGAVDSIA